MDDNHSQAERSQEKTQSWGILHSAAKEELILSQEASGQPPRLRVYSDSGDYDWLPLNMQEFVTFHPIAGYD
jgi:hypothetical protein